MAGVPQVSGDDVAAQIGLQDFAAEPPPVNPNAFGVGNAAG
jgi:hypothetical protein